MLFRVTDLASKEVVNINDGSKLGRIDDAEVDMKTSEIKNFIIHGKPRLFGLLGRGEDVVINFDEIEMVGEDIVIVKMASTVVKRNLGNNGGFFQK